MTCVGKETGQKNLHINGKVLSEFERTVRDLRSKGAKVTKGEVAGAALLFFVRAPSHFQAECLHMMRGYDLEGMRDPQIVAEQVQQTIRLNSTARLGSEAARIERDNPSVEDLARMALDASPSDQEQAHRQRAVEDVDAVVGDIEGGRQKSPRTPRGKPKGA